jgi:DNA ligase-1
MRFSDLCDAYLAISKTAKRLEKTSILADLLHKTPAADLGNVMMLLKGRVYPEWDKTQLGISSKLAIKAIGLATGENEANIVKAFKKQGDIGQVAQSLREKKRQHTLASHDLSVKDVITGLRKVSAIEGTGSVDQKLKTIAQLLTSATPLETRFLIRILLEDLRVGIADGTIRDAVIDYAMQTHKAEASEKPAWEQAVQEALDKTNDIASVADTAIHHGLAGLQKIPLTTGVPLKVMLAQKELTLAGAFAKVGTPAALEYKYDGFRMQIHKHGKEVWLFTRRLENVTAQFPDVVGTVKEHIHDDCILDAEAVGFDRETGKYTAFQHISQRIRRKYEIEALAKELPVELNVFDIISHHGKAVYTLPFSERRKLVEHVVPKKTHHIKPSAILIVTEEKEGEKFYKESLAAGNEGIMIKALDAPYKPGSRVGFMIKLKPTMDTFDVVITGAEWGEGKRSGWLTSFTFACQDEDGELLTLGRVGTGLKELEQEGGTTFEHLTNLLKDDIIAEDGKEVTVRPKVVIEIKCEEIQKSPSYTSGFALRFPRFVQVRDDRRPEDVCLLADIMDAFEAQRGRNK